MRAHFTDTYKLSTFQARGVEPWRIPKFNRRLIDTECRQVCEGTGDAVLEGDSPATPGSKENGGRGGTVSQAAPLAVPNAKPPAGRGYGGSSPNYIKQNLDKEFML